VGATVIDSIRISGFRGIKYCELKGLDRINVFIGRNNSGKSSVLEALYLASAAFKYEEPLGRGNNKITYLLNRRCNRDFSWSKGKETLWYRYDDKTPIEIEVRFGRGKAPKIRLIHWHEHPLIATHAEKSGHILQKFFKVFWGYGICLRDGAFLTERASHPIGSSDIMKSLLEAEFRNVDEIRGFMEKIMLVDTGLIHMMYNVEKSLWGDLLKQRLDKLVTDVLRHGYDVEVEDLTYVPYGEVYQLAVKLPETTVRVDDLGDGARFGIVLTMIASLMKNTALLIEEPENYQHPGGLVKSLEMLLTLGKKNDVQVFASTHSVELVKLMERIAKEKNIGMKVFFLERDKEGNVDVRYITSLDIDVLEKLGLDVRFIDII
jgi:hypothetical protein